jgi:hypothetical protein
LAAPSEAPLFIRDIRGGPKLSDPRLPVSDRDRIGAAGGGNAADPSAVTTTAGRLPFSCLTAHGIV